MAAEVGASYLRQVVEALDAEDLTGEPGEQGGLKAQAGSDLEHALSRPERQRLEHRCHERRLRRHLPVGNRNRFVPVGVRTVASRHEARPRYGGDGLKHTLVADARPTNEPREPLRTLRGHLRRSAGLPGQNPLVHDVVRSAFAASPPSSAVRTPIMGTPLQGTLRPALLRSH